MAFALSAPPGVAPLRRSQLRPRRAPGAQPHASAGLRTSPAAPLRLLRRGCKQGGRSARGGRVAAATRATLGGKAAEALEKGKQTYATGERMAALKLFEAALDSMEPPLEVQRELLYSCACCHAAFGDIEQAWMCLRDSMEMGLSYDAAEADPSMMRMEASAQMRNQLRKYAEGRNKSPGTVAREAYERTRKTPGTTVGERSFKPTSASEYSMQNLDVSNDTDDSFGAIAKRVLGLLAVGVIGGAVLFKLGLSTLR